ncbi:hypothetical protein A9R01_13600 ['Osedax' symbiont bacterium Rs2_46_30_T18]|nr:hypothetical protein A9R01_13600 ['Osedax' symbiont bacterium Rs2_46_30_T18]
METVSDKRLSKRILTLFIFTTCVLIVQGIYNIYSLDGVNNSITKVYDSVNLVSSTSSNVALPISELRQLSMSLVMAPNKSLRETLKIQIIELKSKTELALSNGKFMASSDPKSQELFNAIKKAWQDYAKAVEVTLDYVKEAVRIAEFISVTVYEKQAYDKVTNAIIAYNAYQIKISANTFHEAQKNATIAFWAVLITTLVEVLILKLILSYVLNLVRAYVAARKQHAKELLDKDEALLRSEKMAALGRLVAGMAHELNTPIGVCVTGASFLQEKTDDLIKAFSSGNLRQQELNDFVQILPKSTEIILSNLDRASELISSFKLVAVDVSSDMKRKFNLQAYIANVVQSLYPETKRFNHQVSIQGDSELVVETYPGSISQIITNLMMNSIIHAYSDKERGCMSISAFRDEDNVKLIYRDDGKGLSEENVKMIFEPFYTTRSGHGGSGLGMSLVYNLVTQTLKGTITCTSELGKGININISFPIKADITNDKLAEMYSLNQT